MSVWVFSDLATMSQRLNEGGVTPVGGVWLWQGPVFDESGILVGLEAENLYHPLTGADGRCAMMHPFCEEDDIFIEALCADLIVSGKVQKLDALPPDWKYPDPPVTEEMP